VPFALGFQVYPWLERFLQLRQNPFVAYGFAVAMIALAVLVRWFVGEYVGARIPFVTFYPAIVFATLIGGLWPGILATILSTVAAWLLFVPPYFSFALGERELVQLLLFIVISGINVVIVGLLDALIRRLVIQQRNIRLLLDSAPNGFVLVDELGTIKLVNASTEKLFGYNRNELTGKAVDFLVPEQHVDAHRRLRAAYQQKPEVRSMGLGRDLNGRRKDGSEFALEIGLNPLDRDGQQAVLATVMDISARKRAEQHQRLLVQELQHRTQNLFAVVSALVRNSLKEAKTVAEAEQALSGRIKALSEAYVLLADAAWEGASLAQILDRQFSVYSNRIIVDGCEITITPRAAQQFSLIAHELSTNSLKYGALSAPDGQILISGNIDQRNGAERFVFSWNETGGPRVSPPTRRGFGSVILLESAQQFGTVAVDYAPEGLQYQLEVDLTTIEVPKKLETRSTPPTMAIRLDTA